MVGRIIAGVDEAGRGPLAGPVVAAAVIFKPRSKITGLTDSKQLTHEKREFWYLQIMKRALAVGVGEATVAEIDAINILQATFLAMHRAVEALTTKPTHVWIDGNQTPPVFIGQYQTEAIVQGDEFVAEISAASIIAKVTRDRIMTSLALEYPQYGFAQHKGYTTQLHLTKLRQHGPSPIHRRHFMPVQQSQVLADQTELEFSETSH